MSRFFVRKNGTGRRGLRLWVGVFAVVAAGTAAVVPASPASAAIGCRVDYRVATDWGSGFVATAVVTNLGDRLPSYAVTFQFTGNQRVVQGWNQQWSQSGTTVTARSASWAPPVATGESVYLAFNGTYSGANPPPVDWRVNGVSCLGAGQPRRVVVEPSELTAPEGGDSVAFTVRLSDPPQETVQVWMDVQTTGQGRWAVPNVALTFTPTDWSTAKPFSVSSADDEDSFDDVIVLTPIVAGYQSANVTITQIDDDPADAGPAV